MRHGRILTKRLKKWLHLATFSVVSALAWAGADFLFWPEIDEVLLVGGGVERDPIGLHSMFGVRCWMFGVCNGMKRRRNQDKQSGRTSNIEHRTSNIQHRTPNIEWGWAGSRLASDNNKARNCWFRALWVL
jgi:hypothetical protein